MIVQELTSDTEHPSYQLLRQSNLERQYGFMQSAIGAAVTLGHHQVSDELIVALNCHATACLNPRAGEYRAEGIEVAIRRGPGDPPGHQPPPGSAVKGLMSDFVSIVNAGWEDASPVELGAYCAWAVNHIHPFTNGNGRTARALCYHVLCVKLGGLLPGSPMLPERIRSRRAEYVEKLQAGDRGDLAPLVGFIDGLLTDQIASGD